MRIWTAVAGALLIAGTLYEVFVDLFHPARSGMLSDFIGRRLFNLLRRWKTLLPAAGPLTILVVIAVWATTLACGFALVYWSDPRGVWPNTEHGFGAALYFSMEALTTLGLGEIQPTDGLLRTLAAFESIVGLGLVTASVSWIVLLYPALSRMRCLARRVFILHDAQQRTGLELGDAGAEALLDELLIATIRMRIDFIHFPLIYYFAAMEDRGSLPGALGMLNSCAEECARDADNNRMRLGGVSLQIALDELASLIRERFVPSPDANRANVFDRYRQDHLLE